MPDLPLRPRRLPLRPALWLLLAFALLDTGVRAFAPVWERYSPDDYALRVDGCREARRDFIVLGGSPVSEAFDPAAMAGLAWDRDPLPDGYSIGLPGGTLTDFVVALRHAAPVPPRLVIYGAAPTDINDDRNEPHGVDSLYTGSDVTEVIGRRPDLTEWILKKFVEAKVRHVSAIYTHRHGVKMAAAAALHARFPSACPEAAREAGELRRYADTLTHGNGYAPAAIYADNRYDLRKAAGVKPAPFGFLNKYRTGSHWRYFDVLREWCSAHAVTLVVVEMPVTADLEDRYPAQLREFRERLAEVTAAGVPVIRADRGTLGFTDADFGDIIHLNRGGAAKFSPWVRDAVNALSTDPRRAAP